MVIPEQGVRVGRLIERPAWRDLLPYIEDIFLATSEANRFDDEHDRKLFEMRWLGRYMEHFPNSFFIASHEDGTLAGYLAGCLENPALNSLFDDVGYFKKFADLCALYPGHLHMNIDARFRNRGIGVALIEAFIAHASNYGLPGVHVVTDKDARNARFYARNAFKTLAEASWSNGTIIFMGRRLGKA